MAKDMPSMSWQSMDYIVQYLLADLLPFVKWAAKCIGTWPEWSPSWICHSFHFSTWVCFMMCGLWSDLFLWNCCSLELGRALCSCLHSQQSIWTLPLYLNGTKILSFWVTVGSCKADFFGHWKGFKTMPIDHFGDSNFWPFCRCMLL